MSTNITITFRHLYCKTSIKCHLPPPPQQKKKKKTLSKITWLHNFYIRAIAESQNIPLVIRTQMVKFTFTSKKSKKPQKNQQIRPTQKLTRKNPNTVPALRHVIDLALDSHEQRLFGVRSIVLLELLLSDLPDLYRRRQRLRLFLEFPGPLILIR
jgi:hypothetical protein